MSGKIDEIAFAAYPAFAMLAAMKLGVFNHLAEGPKTLGELARSVRADSDRLEQLLYTLVASDLLNLLEDRFSNTNEISEILAQRSPNYMRDRAQYFSDRWAEALQTADSIAAGQAKCKIDYSVMDHAKLESFLRGLLPVTIEEGKRLSEQFDLSSCKKLLDVGGGSGGLAIGLTQANPELKATVVDLPNVIPVCQLLLAENGADQFVDAVPLDITTEMPSDVYDVAILKDFVQVLPEDKARSAIANVYSALAPGGSMIIIGHVVDDSRLSPRQSVFFNLVFLNIYDAGGAYPAFKYEDWISSAGFIAYRRAVDSGGVSTISARKPA